MNFRNILKAVGLRVSRPADADAEHPAAPPAPPEGAGASSPTATAGGGPAGGRAPGERGNVQPHGKETAAARLWPPGAGTETCPSGISLDVVEIGGLAHSLEGSSSEIKRIERLLVEQKATEQRLDAKKEELRAMLQKEKDEQRYCETAKEAGFAVQEHAAAHRMDIGCYVNELNDLQKQLLVLTKNINDLVAAFSEKGESLYISAVEMEENISKTVRPIYDAHATTAPRRAHNSCFLDRTWGNGIGIESALDTSSDEWCTTTICDDKTMRTLELGQAFLALSQSQPRRGDLRDENSRAVFPEGRITVRSQGTPCLSEISDLTDHSAKNHSTRSPTELIELGDVVKVIVKELIQAVNFGTPPAKAFLFQKISKLQELVDSASSSGQSVSYKNVANEDFSVSLPPILSREDATELLATRLLVDQRITEKSVQQTPEPLAKVSDPVASYVAVVGELEKLFFAHIALSKHSGAHVSNNPGLSSNASIATSCSATSCSATTSVSEVLDKEGVGRPSNITALNPVAAILDDWSANCTLNADAVNDTNSSFLAPYSENSLLAEDKAIIYEVLEQFAPNSQVFTLKMRENFPGLSVESCTAEMVRRYGRVVTDSDSEIKTVQGHMKLKNTRPLLYPNMERAWVENAKRYKLVRLYNMVVLSRRSPIAAHPDETAAANI